MMRFLREHRALALGLLVVAGLAVAGGPGGAFRRPTGSGSSGADTCTGSTCTITGPVTAQQATFSRDAGVVARRFVSTVSEAASSSYECNNISSSSPCLQQLTSALEIFGRVADRTYSDVYASDILLSARAASDGGVRETGYIFSVWNNETPEFLVGYDGRLRLNTGEFVDGYGNSMRLRAMTAGAPVYVQGSLNSGSAGGDLLFGSLQSRSAGYITYTFNLGTQVQGVTYQGATHYTGVATGSLPTCDGTTAGQVQYDTTTTTMKWCNGTAWQSFSANPYRVWTSACPSGANCETAETDWVGAFESTSNDSNAAGTRVTCSWDTVGTATGTQYAQIQIRDPSGGQLCECTISACNAAVRTAYSCTCPGALVNGRKYNVRWSQPDDGGTGCTAMPKQAVCNLATLYQ